MSEDNNTEKYYDLHLLLQSGLNFQFSPLTYLKPGNVDVKMKISTSIDLCYAAIKSAISTAKDTLKDFKFSSSFLFIDKSSDNLAIAAELEKEPKFKIEGVFIIENFEEEEWHILFFDCIIAMPSRKIEVWSEGI